MRDDATAPGRPAGTEAPLPAIAFEREPGAATAPLPPSFARGYKRCQPELTALHAIVRDNLETFLAEGRRASSTGAISFLQRATGALTLYPHIHSIIPDGLFVEGEDPQGALRFVVLPSPTDDEIVALTTRVVRRLIKVAKKYRAERGEEDPFDEPADQLLRACATEALRSPTPAPPQTVASRVANKPLTARLEDFSLHAGRFVPAFNRAELEALCRYGLRPPFSTERLSLLDDGMVRYELPKPTASGHTELRLSPLALLRRLTAILPAPFVRLVRSHGVFSARSCFRQRLRRPTNDGEPELLTPDGRPLLASDLATPPPAPEPNASEAAPPAAEPEYPAPAPPPSLPPRRKALWAQLLCRVLQVDALECPKCAASMVVVAFISDPAVVTKILRHLQLATTPAPLGPAREPEDDYDGMAQDVPGDDDAQASPPDGDASRGRGS